MKKNVLYLLSCLLVAGLFSCKKDKTSEPENLSDDPNSITIAANKLNTPALEKLPGDYPAFFSINKNIIYYGNASNSSTAQYFIAYNPATNSFSEDLTTTTELCACGANSKLLSNGSQLYYIANEANSYNPGTDSWEALSYPASVQTGESAVGVYNNKIYFAGGRIGNHVVNYYDIATDKWFSAPDYPNNAGSAGMIAYKDRIYVFGGSGNNNKAAYLDIVANKWVSVKNMPFEGSFYVDYSWAQLCAVYHNYILVLQGSKIYIYNPEKDTWADTPIDLSELNSITSGNILMGDNKIYIAGNSTATKAFTVFELAVASK